MVGASGCDATQLDNYRPTDVHSSDIRESSLEPTPSLYNLFTDYKITSVEGQSSGAPSQTCRKTSAWRCTIGNRKPTKNESQECGTFLERQFLNILQPITDLIGKTLHQRGRPPTEQSICIGYSRNAFHPIEVSEALLSISHLTKGIYVCGKSGMGKTTFIRLMTTQFMRAGLGFVVIDPHGDLSQAILNVICQTCKTEEDFAYACKRLILLEPFHPTLVPRINLLHSNRPEQAYVEAIDMLAIFERIFSDVVWGARMKETLRNVLLTLSLSGHPLIDAPRLLSDSAFQNKVVNSLSDPDLLFYWKSRFAGFSDRMKPMITEPVSNKLSVLTEGPLMRHLAAQTESLIDFRGLLDNRNWVIINLSKGLLGQHSKLLGSIFTAKIKSAAMSRADIPESERIVSPLLIDEFQNFSGDNYEEILSEARKYRLALLLAHQNLDQIKRSMRAAIFGNVGTMLLFRLGHRDIREFAQEFNSTNQPMVRQALASLQIGEMVKREDDGSFCRIQVPRPNELVVDGVIEERLRQACYDRYYRPRAEIDAELIKARSVSARSSVVIYESPKWARKSPSDAGDEVSP